MADRVFPAVRVRPVRGRTIDPFRGTPIDADEDAARFASRTVDSQPIDDLVAVFERVPGVRVVRAGRRFTIGRGHDVIKVAFASAARRVSLDDATFEGDGNLVITVLHALLPLFGAVEVTVGDHRALIDGHEPLAQVLERYDAWWIEESLKLARQMAARDAAAPRGAAPAPAKGQPYVRRKQSWRPIVFGIVLAVLALGLGAGTWIANRKADVGEACKRNKDCDSDKCLPREPVQATSIGGVVLGPGPQVYDPNGVCTKLCTVDADCPAAMQCGEVMNYSFGLGTRTSSCIPRAWF